MQGSGHEDISAAGGVRVGDVVYLHGSAAREGCLLDVDAPRRLSGRAEIGGSVGKTQARLSIPRTGSAAYAARKPKIESAFDNYSGGEASRKCVVIQNKSNFSAAACVFINYEGTLAGKVCDEFESANSYCPAGVVIRKNQWVGLPPNQSKRTIREGGGSLRDAHELHRARGNKRLIQPHVRYLYSHPRVCSVRNSRQVHRRVEWKIVEATGGDAGYTDYSTVSRHGSRKC